ncbi:MAG: DUF4062 domain-containing protein [Planctomycetota bacterium]
MTTKYQVFVSSTFRDLKEHRASAMKAIVSAGHMATCLENWGLSHEDQLEVISRAVQDCQFYLIVLGHTYGSIPRGKRKSYTEIELDIAERQGKPILSMVLNELLVKKQRKKLSPTDPVQKREIDNDDRYWKLRERLCSAGRWFNWFRTPADVETHVHGYFKNPPSGLRGYVLETEETKSIISITTSNQVVADIVRRAGGFKTIEDRLGDASDQKKALASAFRDLHGRHLGLFDKIFIESGSTLTYVAAEIAELLPKSLQLVPVRSKGEVARPIVTTNNALAYLDLWLVNGVLCQPEPDFPPAINEPYGAMYGSLTGIARHPDYFGRPIEDEDPDAWAAVCRIRDDFLKGSHNPNKTLVLAAASAMQLSPSKRAAEYGDGRETCIGFHVGSYENKLFKRCLYLTGVPAIVFIHDKKVGLEPNWGKCHFVFDRGYSWDRVLNDYPLSIWIGCTKKTVVSVEEQLKGHFPSTWKFRRYPSEEHPVIVAHNEEFRSSMAAVGINVYQ